MMQKIDIPSDGIYDPVENTYISGTGQSMQNIHSFSDECRKYGCVIHIPSDHGMRKWPTKYRWDTNLMERICEHGIGHPDPDNIDYWTRHGQEHMGVHGCDGCCGKVHAKKPRFIEDGLGRKFY